MKASDLNLPKGMEVYVDMDGVLADFFHEYAKLAGVPPNKFGRHDYRSIPPAKADPTLNKMVGTDFFARLPKFSTADQLLRIVVDAAGHYNICSSPLRGDHEGSEKWKRVWIKKELAVQPKNIFITPRKEKYAVGPTGVPNVLIDDRGDNISKWEAAGGIGIKYQADEDTLKKVLEGLKRARRVGQGEEKHVPQELKSLDRGGSNAIATAKDEPVKEDRRSGFYVVHKFETNRNNFAIIGSPTKFSRSAMAKTFEYLEQTNKPVKVTINDHQGAFDSVIIEPGDHVKSAIERLGFIDDSPDLEPDNDIKESENNVSGANSDIKSILKDFLPIAKRELKLDKMPPIRITKYIKDSDQPTFGKFVNGERTVFVGIEDRHPLDILRTLAHELVHYKQYLRGELGHHSGDTGSPEENEAHEKAGVIMRHFDKKFPDYFEKPAIDTVPNKINTKQGH